MRVMFASVVMVLGCGGGSGSVDDAGADASLSDASLLDAAIDADPTPDALVADAIPAGMVDPNGTHYHFVIDDLLVPTTAAEANIYGLDIDGDPIGRPDNALGQILSVLVSQEPQSNPQPMMDDAVRTGGWIGLVDIKTVALTTAAGVGVWWLDGQNPSPPACNSPSDPICGHHLSGSATFDVATPDPGSVLLVGNLVGSRLQAGPNLDGIQLPVPLLFSSKLVMLPMVGTRIEVGTVSATDLSSGKIGGGVRESDIQTIFVPALATELDAILAAECAGLGQDPPPCGCPAGSSAEAMQNLFDEDSSCTITTAEIQNNSLISSLLAPDVDLFDSTGAFNPRVDGIKDSLSIGYGFSAVGASFTPPAP